MKEETLSTILQIILFTLIPFLVYLIKTKSAKGFWNYIGLKKSRKNANFLALLVMLLMALPILMLTIINQEFREVMTNPESVTGKIRQMGFGIEAVATILIVAIFKTSLSEEIFFRGFLAKRLIAITSFQTGNIIQAFLFGAIHVLIFIPITDSLLFLPVIFFFPALGAYFITYLNEKLADGSIIPGWIAHGTANLVSYSFVAFIL
jgi:membrane protease YdiL (CAAX protease family)